LPFFAITVLAAIIGKNILAARAVEKEPDPANPPKERLSHCGSSAIRLAS
jgi:hypothetical protein